MSPKSRKKQTRGRAGGLAGGAGYDLQDIYVARQLAALLGPLARAEAGIVVTVDKTAQRLSVSVDGSPRYEWPVSTARWGYRTPNGSYRPQWLARKWFSRKYDWSPMPYSIFFDEGYAIHGSYEISHLGRPASHGCIRMPYGFAEKLFNKTRIGMRVIIAPNDAAPVEFSHTALFMPNAEAIAAAIFVAGSVGLIFGFYPAWKVQPISRLS